MLSLVALGVLAGALNAVAGGGPIIVVAALATLGWPATVASLSSTVALMPGQLLAGWRGGAQFAATMPRPTRSRLLVIAVLGGAAGAGLLLLIPATIFAAMLPGLVLVATLLYAWSSRIRRVDAARSGASPDRVLLGMFVPVSIYGGFYGGGNSFLVLALLAHAGLPVRTAAHVKNLLILLINAAATLIFLCSGRVSHAIAVPIGIGAVAGSLVGSRLIDRIGPATLRPLVVVIGLTLAGWLAVRS